MNIYFTVWQLKTLILHFQRSYNINNADNDEQHSLNKDFSQVIMTMSIQKWSLACRLEYKIQTNPCFKSLKNKNKPKTHDITYV